MFHSYTVDEILPLVFQNLRSRDTSHIPFGGNMMRALVLLCINQHEISSDWGRDGDIDEGTKEERERKTITEKYAFKIAGFVINLCKKIIISWSIHANKFWSVSKTSETNPSRARLRPQVPRLRPRDQDQDCKILVSRPRLRSRWLHLCCKSNKTRCHRNGT